MPPPNGGLPAQPAANSQLPAQPAANSRLPAQPASLPPTSSAGAPVQPTTNDAPPAQQAAQPSSIPPASTPLKPTFTLAQKSVGAPPDGTAAKGKGKGQAKKTPAAAGVKRPGEDVPIGQGKAKKSKQEAAPVAPVGPVPYSSWSAANPMGSTPMGVLQAAAPPNPAVGLGGVKRPPAGLGGQQPAQKKQRDDDVTRLQDVTAVAGLDLEQEAQHSMALAGAAMSYQSTLLKCAFKPKRCMHQHNLGFDGAPG
jgi:hypothetical protein